jgi:hypothetical protein
MTTERRRLCAHADNDGQGMHWLEPGEECRDEARQHCACGLPIGKHCTCGHPLGRQDLWCAYCKANDEGWVSYAAEQDRHAETAAKLARSFSRSEVERALRAADVPEDSMATDDDLIRYEGHAEAVRIMRDMLDV